MKENFRLQRIESGCDREWRKKENGENNYCWKFILIQENGITKDIIIPRKWEEPGGDYIQDTLTFINFNF